MQQLISEFEIFELKNNSVGSLSKNEEFMMKVVKKLSHYIEHIKANNNQAPVTSDFRVVRLQQQITEMSLEY